VKQKKLNGKLIKSIELKYKNIYLEFRSVQMRLYVLHKRQFVSVFILFFICLFLTILIGIAGPSVIQTIDYKSENPGKQLVKIDLIPYLFLIIFF
jgi:hypothetical protein